MKRVVKFSVIGGGVIFVLAAVVATVLAFLLSPDVELDQPAPQITLTDAEGKPFTLDAFEGKLVLLDFWAST